MRVVLDTNVLLSLWVFAGSRFSRLRELIERGDWVALCDEYCLAEFKRVLAYEAFGLSDERQAQVYVDYSAIAQFGHAPKGLRHILPRCSDPDDQKFLELAHKAGADWLITSDKALLKLARRNKLGGLFHIVTPESALATATKDQSNSSSRSRSFSTVASSIP